MEDFRLALGNLKAVIADSGNDSTLKKLIRMSEVMVLCNVPTLTDGCEQWFNTMYWERDKRYSKEVKYAVKNLKKKYDIWELEFMNKHFPDD